MAVPFLNLSRGASSATPNLSSTVFINPCFINPHNENTMPIIKTRCFCGKSLQLLRHLLSQRIALDRNRDIHMCRKKLQWIWKSWAISLEAANE